VLEKHHATPPPPKLLSPSGGPMHSAEKVCVCVCLCLCLKYAGLGLETCILDDPPWVKDTKTNSVVVKLQTHFWLLHR
jgi:hypothetical protein